MTRTFTPGQHLARQRHVCGQELSPSPGLPAAGREARPRARFDSLEPKRVRNDLIRLLKIHSIQIRLVYFLLQGTFSLSAVASVDSWRLKAPHRKFRLKIRDAWMMLLSHTCIPNHIYVYPTQPIGGEGEVEGESVRGVCEKLGHTMPPTKRH